MGKGEMKMNLSENAKYDYLLQAKKALNLQLFAEGEGGTPPEFTGPQSQSELDSLIGKAVNTALANAKKDWETQTKEQIETAKTQAEKLGQMSAEEKAAEAERQRLAELDEKERRLNQRELKFTASDILSEKGLPTKLADILNYSDENTVKAHIDVVSEAFSEAVQAEVDKRLAASIDIPAGGTTAKPTTKSEQFAKEMNQRSENKKSLWG